MIKKIAMSLVMLLIATDISIACVGKTIYVGYVDKKNDEIIANVFSRLILERTGTTAKLKKFNTPNAVLTAAQNGDVDLFVFSDEQIKNVINSPSHDDAKNEFNVKYNLVWLKPIVSNKMEFFVPVIRKDTLKKFPALPKLIEKLEGKINNSTLNHLNTMLKNKSIKDVVKDFLKENKLI